MARASRSVAKRARHKKWIKRAKGYKGRRSRIFKLAKEAVLKAGQHAFHDRRKKKGQFRGQWQVTINAAVREHGMSYSRFIQMLRSQEIALDRKVLAQIILDEPQLFDQLITTIMKQSGDEKKSK